MHGFKPALISKGLRPGGAAVFLAVFGFKPALISKGLRLRFPGGFGGVCRRFKPALISKGLRPVRGGGVYKVTRFKPALISKGLRRCPNCGFHKPLTFQTSPDFKGIKT